MYNRRACAIWSQRISLSLKDQLNFNKFVNEERNYYNHVINGLAGPIRTFLPEYIDKFNGKFEDLLGEIAVRGDDLRLFKNNVPQYLKDYENMIQNIDEKMMLVFDIVRKKANIIPQVRKGIAIESIKYAKDQIDRFNTPALTPDDSYRFSIIMLTEHDNKSKRHIQIPKNATKYKIDKKNLSIFIPYFTTWFTIQNPSELWNYIILRQEEDGRMMIELLNEKSLYQIAYTDPITPKKKLREKIYGN